jgi:membrane associated rhomboid family serine protease
MFPIHDDTQRVHGRPYLNYTLIAINVAVFIWEAMQTSFFTDPRAVAELFFTYGTVPADLFANWPASGFNIVTSMFMHGGVAHIIGNMVFLWVFGDNIEDKFGRVKYILIYLGWGAAAAFAHSFYAMSTGEGAIPAVGASGAISGILGAYLVMFPRAKVLTAVAVFFIYMVRIPVIAYIPFWFIMQVIFVFIGATSGVAYLAHIGGFVAGAATGLVARSFVLPQLAKLAGTGKTYTPPVRRVRPKIEDIVTETPPEVIEGPGYYEIIAEIRGVRDASEITAEYDPAANAVKIQARGTRRYETSTALPAGAGSVRVDYIHYLNGIARIRLAKEAGQV